MRPLLPMTEVQRQRTILKMGVARGQDGARAVTEEKDKSPHILCSVRLRLRDVTI